MTGVAARHGTAQQHHCRPGSHHAVNLTSAAVAQNRVTPFGTIEDLPGRGTLMGNRGILHDGTERVIRRRWANKAWIACALEFKGWRAPMWEDRRWTALFFLDEATAFAAGHRPCALCRRADHSRFREAWGESQLADIDARLHVERISGRGSVLPEVGRADVLTGVMVALNGRAWLVHDDALLPWSSSGYGRPRRIPERVSLLTPPALVEVVWRGYEPSVHATAR